MYHIIVNPASKSGRGRKIWHTLLPILRESQINYTVSFTTGAGDAAKILRRYISTAKELPIRLLVLGGDGTMNEVIQGIDDFSQVHVTYLPTGSSNDLARDLGIPKDPAEYLKHILASPKLIEMDLGQVTYIGIENNYTRRFAVSCGIGFDAAVCAEALASPIKNFFNKIGLGKLTYLGIALKQIINNKNIPCELYLDDAAPIQYPRFLFIVAMLHRYEGGGFMFCPHAEATDGLLDVCAVGDVSRMYFLRTLPSAFSGKHIGRKGITEHRAKEIRIKTASPLWVHTDGEVKMPSSEIHITCIPEKLRFMI